MKQRDELDIHTLNGAAEHVLTQLRAAFPDLSDRYQISYLGLFGSYLHGNHDRHSDLDLLVAFESPPTLFQFVRLQNELANLLGLPVDLVMKSALKPEIGKHILSEVVAV
jgi:predicted nucleotidyltransferase